jgi:hypothetical protein
MAGIVNGEDLRYNFFLRLLKPCPLFPLATFRARPLEKRAFI